MPPESSFIFCGVASILFFSEAVVVGSNRQEWLAMRLRWPTYSLLKRPLSLPLPLLTSREISNVKWSYRAYLSLVGVTQTRIESAGGWRVWHRLSDILIIMWALHPPSSPVWYTNKIIQEPTGDILLWKKRRKWWKISKDLSLHILVSRKNLLHKNLAVSTKSWCWPERRLQERCQTVVANSRKK